MLWESNDHVTCNENVIYFIILSITMWLIKLMTLRKMMAVWEHGCSWEEAEGDGYFLCAVDGGWRWYPCWSTLLSRPRWLHGGDMRLWQPPRDPYSGREGSDLLTRKPSDNAASAADPSGPTTIEMC